MKAKLIAGLKLRHRAHLSFTGDKTENKERCSDRYVPQNAVRDNHPTDIARYKGCTAKPTKKSLIDSKSSSVLEVFALNSLFFNMAMQTKLLATSVTRRTRPFQTDTVTNMVVKAADFLIS